MTPLTTPGGVLLVILRRGVPPGSSNPDLTKIGKVYTRFQTKTAQKPYPMGRQYLYGLYKGVPHPGYDFDFSFSQGHKRSSDSAYESDSVVNSFAISLTSVVGTTP